MWDATIAAVVAIAVAVAVVVAVAIAVAVAVVVVAAVVRVSNAANPCFLGDRICGVWGFVFV